MQIRNSRLLVLLAGVLAAQSPAKRPLAHTDYDSWRNIQNQQLSRDGKFLAYAMFPQDGDGEVVVRHLVTGQERREPAGARPPLPAPDALNPEARPEPRNQCGRRGDHGRQHGGRRHQPERIHQLRRVASSEIPRSDFTSCFPTRQTAWVASRRPAC